MHAVLATIADGGRAIVVINREAEEINYFLLQFIDSTKIICSQGYGMLVYQNHAALAGNVAVLDVVRSWF